MFNYENANLYYQKCIKYDHVVTNYKTNKNGGEVVKGKEVVVEGRGPNKELRFSSRIVQDPSLSSTKDKEK